MVSVCDHDGCGQTEQKEVSLISSDYCRRDGVCVVQDPGEIRELSGEGGQQSGPQLPEEQRDRGDHPVHLQEQRRSVPGPPPRLHLVGQESQGARRGSGGCGGRAGCQDRDDRRVRAARRSGGRGLLHGGASAGTAAEHQSRRATGSVARVGRRRRGREGEELPHGGGVRRDGTDAASTAADAERVRLVVGTSDRAGNRAGGGARYSHRVGGDGLDRGGRAIRRVRVEGRRWSQEAGEGAAAGRAECAGGGGGVRLLHLQVRKPAGLAAPGWADLLAGLLRHAQVRDVAAG